MGKRYHVECFVEVGIYQDCLYVGFVIVQVVSCVYIVYIVYIAAVG